MPDLSPPAQAVLSAYRADWKDEQLKQDVKCLAAALRAAAELEVIKPHAVGPRDASYGSSSTLITISEQEFKYHVALAVKQAKVNTYRALRAIASDLETQ